MSERSTAEILRAARERIAPVAGWTQGAFARDEDGRKCDPTDPGAVCFCSLGALYAEHGVSIDIYTGAERLLLSGREFLNRAAREREHQVTWINDFRGHGAVLDLYDRAIELAEAGA